MEVQLKKIIQDINGSYTTLFGALMVEFMHIHGIGTGALSRQIYL
jgi:hypothetical protein